MLLRPLAAFMLLVLGCAALIGATVNLTGARIDQNRQQQFLAQVRALTGGAELPDGHWLDDRWPLCDGQVLRRGSARGYAGHIHWLAAITRADGDPRLQAVRITAHQETPGIVDFLDDPDGPWLAALAGRGGAELAQVDRVSGATITSQALLRNWTGILQHEAERARGEGAAADPSVGAAAADAGCPE